MSAIFALFAILACTNPSREVVLLDDLREPVVVCDDGARLRRQYQWKDEEERTFVAAACRLGDCVGLFRGDTGSVLCSRAEDRCSAVPDDAGIIVDAVPLAGSLKFAAVTDAGDVCIVARASATCTRGVSSYEGRWISTDGASLYVYAVEPEGDGAELIRLKLPAKGNADVADRTEVRLGDRSALALIGNELLLADAASSALLFQSRKMTRVLSYPDPVVAAKGADGSCVVLVNDSPRTLVIGSDGRIGEAQTEKLTAGCSVSGNDRRLYVFDKGQSLDGVQVMKLKRTIARDALQIHAKE